MKNVKYLSFVVLGCALLLTGCGGESNNSITKNGSEKNSVKHILTCSMTDEEESLKMEIEFNDKEDEVIGTKIFLTTKVPNGVSADEIEYIKDYVKESLCSDGSYKDCKSSVSGNSLTVEATVPSSNLEDEGLVGTKDEVSESFKFTGYACE